VEAPSSAAQPRLSDALPLLERLSLQGLEWVARSGHPDLPLQTAAEPSRRKAIAQAVGAVMDELQDEQLGELLPALQLLADERIDVAVLSPRLRGTLRRNGVHTWGQVARLSIREVMLWPSTGPGLARELLVQATDQAIAASSA
jgi:hypothetical protein